MKQTAHKRTYKSGKKIMINSHIRKKQRFPLGKEKELEIEWDKRKLLELYDQEKLGLPLGKETSQDEGNSPGENIYLFAAKGLKIWDPIEKINTYKKIPYSELPRESKSHLAQLESNLIKGGFFDSKTGKNVSLETMRKKLSRDD